MQNLLKKLFKKAKTKVANSEELLIRQNSQPHALAHYMRCAGIKHGELVEANIKNVRIDRTDKAGEIKIGGDLTLFLCPISGVDVIERIAPGDHSELPSLVMLHKMTVPSNIRLGVYNINNVMLMANGKINVMTTKNTVLERIG